MIIKEVNFDASIATATVNTVFLQAVQAEMERGDADVQKLNSYR
jgi:hypothetical protein